MPFKQFAFSLILACLTGCNTLTPGAPPAAPQQVATPTAKETATVTTATATPRTPLTPTNVPGVVSLSSAAVRAAVLRLSHEGIADPNLVSVVRVIPTTWPDDCLGLPSGLVCHSTPTPGYLIELEQGGQHYLVRTDQEGKQARLAGSSVAPLYDAFIQWRYIDKQECKNALIGTEQVRYGICGEALLASKLNGPPGMGPSIVDSSEATYLKRKYAPFTASTIRGTLVFTGTGTVKAGRAEQRAIAEWASYAWAQADLTYLSADVGLSLFWHEETNTFCGALWVYRTGFAAAWDCPGIKVINSGFLPEVEMEQFYEWLDSGKQWNISRTVGADGKPAKINLDFATTPDGKVTNEDEDKVLQFARQVYVRLSTSPLGILQRFMQARIDGDESMAQASLPVTPHRKWREDDFGGITDDGLSGAHPAGCDTGPLDCRPLAPRC